MAAGQRNVSLPGHVYDRLNDAAAAAGESLATYLTKAADTRRRNDDAAAYAHYCAQPQIAEQITAFRTGVSAYMAWPAEDAA
jgi:hypothetical protein